jgi:plastocyanin
MKNTDCSLSRNISGFALLILIVSALNGCDKPSYEQGNEGYNSHAIINSDLNEFNPSEINISAGQTVTWINNNSNTLTVTSKDGMFEGIIRTNESYTFQFFTTGTYSYYNRVNPRMVGIVNVK